MANSNKKTVKKYDSDKKYKDRRFDKESDKELDREAPSNSCNDVEWYTRFPELAEGAASFNWSNVSGIPYRYLSTTQMQSCVPEAYGKFINPGAVVLDIIPAIGGEKSPNSAINVAATQLYSKVRKANSGSRNYDPVDLAIHVFGVAELFSFCNFCIRTYAMINVWRSVNQYWPRAWFQGMHLNYESFLRNQSNFRSALNGLIDKMSTLSVPASINLFKRRAFIFANVYAEGPSDRDQVYIPNPKSFFTFTHDSDGAGMLSQKVLWERSDELLTWEDLITYGEELMAPFFGDEDTALMMGDIAKAFPDLIKMSPMPEAMYIAPIVDPMFLTQIKNADVLFIDENLIEGGGWDLKQDETKSYLYSFCPLVPELMSLANRVFSTNVNTITKTAFNEIYANTLTGSRLLTANVADADLNWKLNLEMTRLCVPAEIVTEATAESAAEFVTYPTADVISDIRLITLSRSNGLPIVYEAPTVFGSGVSTSDGHNGRNPEFQAMRAFHYLPHGFDIVLSGTTSDLRTPSMSQINPVIQVDNWTIVDIDVFKKMNRAALLSLVVVDPDEYRRTIMGK